MPTAVKRDWANRNAYYRAKRRELKLLISENRACAEVGCGTILSRFNFNRCCHAHNFAYVKRNKIHLRLEELEGF